MKIKIFALGLFFLISCILINSQEFGTTQFTETKWGMTKEEVIKLEGKPVREKEERGILMIVFESEIDNKKCDILYFFAENKLVRTRYHFTHSHVDKNLYIKDYGEIEKQLVEKYGKTKDGKVGLYKLYTSDPDDWGSAVGYGQLKYYAEWELPETHLNLVLTGNNQHVALFIEYKSMKYKDLEEEIRKKAKKKIW
jgi:hypothetical protein